MKKLLLLFILCVPLFVNAQGFTSICSSEPESMDDPVPFDTQVVPDPSEQFVLKVFIHVITDDNGEINDFGVDGNQQNFYDEEEMMDVMYVLNKNYAPHNIFFKYMGYDVIVDDDLTNNIDDNFTDYDVTGSLNLFFVNDLGGDSGSAIPGNILSKFTFQGLRQEFDYLLTHEIGHCLSLWHTFQPSTPCEHVTRDPNDSNYNADSKGDKVADTAASPGAISSWNWVNCVYQNVNGEDDCQGTLFTDIEINYMGYNGTDCQHIFTPGQVLKMRTFLKNLDAPHYIACLTTVDELYIPYNIDHVAGTNIFDQTDNGNGTITVCRWPIWEYRFQKGFDYEFTNPPQAVLTQDMDEWPILNPGGYWMNVKVDQVDAVYEDYMPIGDLRGAPKICEDEPVQEGDMVSVKVIGGPIAVDRKLTITEMHDPGFYSKLTPGYYHFITKRTTRGTLFKKTVYIPLP